MRTLVRLIPLAAALAAPLVAGAQPAPPTPPEGAGSDAATPAAGDDAHTKEIVDREIAKILNDRAATEAAEHGDNAGGPPAPPAAGAEASSLTGSSGFMDTRLAFTLTNENVLVKPGETIPSVPGWRFGVPNSLGVLFFDNYDTRYSGFETLSHAVMYRDFRSGHFEASAAFVLRINELSGSNISLSDDGSYIVLSNWKDPTHKDPTRISLTAFPISADRFRLGYSYRLSWGGDSEYTRAKSPTPGAKIQYDSEQFYVFGGMKAAVVLDRRTAEQKSALAFLGGAGIDPMIDNADHPGVRLEVNGGFFDRGYNELIDVNDQKVQLYGASAQVAIHHGMPVQSSVDYRLYKFNGERVAGLFDPVKYPGGTSWLVMSEGTVIGQTLKDPENTGTTKVQMGMAGDINIRVMIDRVRIRFDASYRDLAFILHSVPSLPTYEDFPKAYSTTPDIFAAVGVDQNWDDFLTLGVIAGVEKPASLTSPIGVPGNAQAGSSTAVIRNNNIDTIITILPPGTTDVVPQFALKGTGKLTFGRIYSALAEVFYSHDPNTTRYQRGGPMEPFQFKFANQNQIGVNVTLQARF